MINSRLRAWIRKHRQQNPILDAFVVLASDSAVYLVAAAIIGLGNFVLVPLYIHSLTPAEFGVYSLVDITVLILVTVALMGFGVSYLKWYSDLDGARRGELLGSTLATVTLTSAIAGALLTAAVASRAGTKWLQNPQVSFAWTLLPIVMLENIQGILLSDLRARRRAVEFSTASVIRLAVVVAASLWFIVGQHQGILGIFLGRLVGDAASVLILAFFCLRSTALHITWSFVVPMIRYGSPLVWSALVGLMLDATGRFFLNHYSTIEQVGYYGAAIKISNIFTMLITQPFGVAWGGLMFQIVKWPNARIIYSKILLYIYGLTLTVAFILALFTPALFAILATPAYYPAMAVFPLILLVRAINIMEYPTAIGLYLGEKTKIFVPIYTIGLLANVSINLILVPRVGMFGAAWAWLVAWVVICGLMAWQGQRFYPLIYEWKSFLIPLLPWVLVMSGRLTAAPGQNHLEWLMRIVLAIVVIVTAVILVAKDFRLSGKQLQLDRTS